MARMRVCDEKHEHPTKAEYRIRKTHYGEQHDTAYERDYCHEHFRKAVDPLISGGLKAYENYELMRVTDDM